MYECMKIYRINLLIVIQQMQKDLEEAEELERQNAELQVNRKQPKSSDDHFIESLQAQIDAMYNE